MTTTAINGRWFLDLPPHRAARPEWATGWERERLDSMYAALCPWYEGFGENWPRGYSPVIYDVGTEEGDLSALYASWGCDVVLVEPNPRVWPNIRYCFEHNGLKPRGWFVGFAGDRVHAGLTPGYLDRNGAVWPDDAYGPLIGDHGFLNVAERPDVTMITLDVLSELSGTVPDAITMDVEGAELLVMRGAGGILDHHRPLVWVSVHPQFSWDMYQLTRDDLLTFMADHDYRAELLAIDHEEHWLFRPGLPGDRAR